MNYKGGSRDYQSKRCAARAECQYATSGEVEGAKLNGPLNSVELKNLLLKRVPRFIMVHHFMTELILKIQPIEEVILFCLKGLLCLQLEY